MSKPKKSSARSKANKRDESVTETSPTKSITAFAQLQKTVPPLRESQQDALLSLFPDDVCAAQGASTRASDILRESRLLVLGYDGLIRDHGKVLHYTLPRYRHLIDQIVLLELKVTEQNLAQRKGRDERSLLEVTTQEARDARENAIALLTRLAGRVPSRLAAVDKARGSRDSADDLRNSLQTLADLAALWIEQSAGDTRLKEVLELHAFTAQDIDDWKRISAALADSIGRSRLDRNIATDLPSTNIVEGRVTLEGQVFYQALLEARAKGLLDTLPPLGATLQRAFNRRKNKAADEQEPTPKPDPKP